MVGAAESVGTAGAAAVAVTVAAATLADHGAAVERCMVAVALVAAADTPAVAAGTVDITTSSRCR